MHQHCHQLAMVVCYLRFLFVSFNMLVYCFMLWIIIVLVYFGSNFHVQSFISLILINLILLFYIFECIVMLHY